MISQYKLLPNEFIIIQCEEMGLLLTNLHIVEIKSKGVFKPTYTINKFLVNKIKEYNGKAQVFIEENIVQIHFINESQSFELYSDKDAVKWANEINKLVTGTNADIESTPINHKEIFTNAVTESTDTGKAMGEAVLGAIPLPGTKFIGRTVGGIVGGVVGSAVKGVSSIVQTSKTSTTQAEDITQSTVSNKCQFCSAPISGTSGQSVHCRYCDSVQLL